MFACGGVRSARGAPLARPIGARHILPRFAPPGHAAARTAGRGARFPPRPPTILPIPAPPHPLQGPRMFHYLPGTILPTLVAAVVAFLIGGLWYSPVLFAKQWIAAHGFGPE